METFADSVVDIMGCFAYPLYMDFMLEDSRSKMITRFRDSWCDVTRVASLGNFQYQLREHLSRVKT